MVVAATLLMLAAALCCGQAVAQQRPGDINTLNREIDRLLKAERLAEAAVAAEQLVAITRARAGESSLAHADALARAAHVYWLQQRHLEAQPLQEKALRIRERVQGPAHVDLVQPLSDLGITYYRLGRAADALPLAERALAIQERRLGADNPAIVPALRNLANTHTHVTSDPLRLEKAEKMYLRAFDLLRRAPGADEEMLLTMGDLATIYQSVGRYEEAERLRKQIVSVRGKRGNERAHILAVEKLAQLYSHQGRPDLAIGLREDLLEQIARLEPGSLGHAGILAPLANDYFNQGRYDESIALHQRSLAILERLRGPEAIELNGSLQNVGTAHYFAGRLAEAERLLRRAIDIRTRSTGGESPTVGQGLGMLAHILRDQGRLDEARTLAARNLAIQEKVHGPDAGHTGIAIDLIASIDHAQHRYPEAKALYRKASAILDRSLGRDHLFATIAIKHLAAVECALGELDAGLAHAREAASLLARRAERSGAREMGARGIYSQGVFPALACAAFGVAGQRPHEREALASEALVAAQQERRTVAEAALAQMALRASAGDATLADAVRRRQDLSGRLRALDQQLIEALSKTDGGKGETDRIRVQRTQAERQLAETNAAIARANPDFAALTNPKSIDLAQARRHLGDDEALVIHMVTDTATYVWAIDRKQIAWERIPLGAAALTQLIAAFRRPLDEWAKAPRGLERLGTDSREACAPVGAADPRGLGRADTACTDDRRFSLARAHELYAALLAPVDPVIRNKRHLVLVPSGPLTGLPFAALVTDKPADATGSLRSFADAPWLVRRHAVTVLPSVSSLALLRQQAKASRATRAFVGVGNPDFSGGAPITGAASQDARGFAGYFRGARADLDALKQGLAPLPDTADELRAIAGTLGAAGSDLLLSRDATERRVKALSSEGRLAQYRVVAFASHGLVAGEVMGLAEPAIALSVPPSASEEDDGLLTASEAAQLKLDADWVVLSACNTAAGGAPGAEALSGLARAFFYAGARALLVSNWPVASPAAVKLTTRSFAALAAEPALGRAEALRRAMLSLIESGAPHEAHPAYWAPFVVVGEGAATR